MWQKVLKHRSILRQIGSPMKNMPPGTGRHSPGWCKRNVPLAGTPAFQLNLFIHPGPRISKASLTKRGNMPQEFTQIKDGFVDLEGGQEEATFRQGILYIRQDAPAMYNDETIQLDARAQMALLKALYERRYALYMGTTLSLGGNDVPDWIASGKAGNVTVVVDGDKSAESAYPTQRPVVHIIRDAAGQQQQSAGAGQPGDDYDPFLDEE
jgi:hypothetical protein